MMPFLYYYGTMKWSYNVRKGWKRCQLITPFPSNGSDFVSLTLLLLTRGSFLNAVVASPNGRKSDISIRPWYERPHLVIRGSQSEFRFSLRTPFQMPVCRLRKKQISVLISNVNRFERTIITLRRWWRGLNFENGISRCVYTYKRYARGNERPFLLLVNANQEDLITGGINLNWSPMVAG